ncbi:MAG: 3-phosphoshikimate 1-carboxyvinyltransferase [Spirochaetaceae bacterium]|nr:3-phosphoshikimate 1-carboxyvinyltransferase [Spirochaetaceae bacterium]
MDMIVTPSTFSQTVEIPPSKSHTIRMILLATLARGSSCIIRPLQSLDASSCLNAAKKLGASIQEKPDENGALESIYIKGIGGAKNFLPQEEPIDVGNSGTTLFLFLSAAALGDKKITFTGDAQIKNRDAGPLLEALKKFGATVESDKGSTPISIRGPWKGGKASIRCMISQYLSSILIAAPLAPKGCVTEVDVNLLNEKPYVEMTIKYLQNQGIIFENDSFNFFRIPGGQSYKPFSEQTPADFSSAAFPALATVVSGGTSILRGLDRRDSQGDKAFFEIIQKMGCSVTWRQKGEWWEVEVSGRKEALRGGVFDLNDTPDLLPAVCVLGAFAKGETRIVNTAHARNKETDRISVMSQELMRAGVFCQEEPDGITIRGTGGHVKGAVFNGHKDHRIVMALSCLARGAEGASTIQGTEAVNVTYPGFMDLIGGAAL